MKNTRVEMIMRLISLLVLLLFVGLAVACSDNTPEPTPSPDVLTISPSELPEATTGQPYQATIIVTGNRTPVGYIGTESGALPLGLEIQYQQIENTAVIKGTPEEVGTFNFTVDTWCMGTNQPGQTAHKDYELVVK